METTPPTAGGAVRRRADRLTPWACLGAILLLCGGWARAAEPKVVRLPLAEAVKAPLDPCSLDDLAKRWPAFRHEPFDTAGFNHLALPFRYEAGPQGGDANEALAFSFLLSEALDWARGCYCTRHAYFIFKRGERYMRPLAKAYDQRAIAFAVKDWTATHAVGGLLRKKAGGYGGVLEIYSADGNLLSSTPYQAPRAYFTLLGDMAADALRFFGHPPSKALVAHLHKPRCNNFQSIQDLGAAAFAKEKTPEEFGLYDKILKRDPGFAEVRYWWACQKQWKDGDLNAYYLESARSMRDYLTPSALETFIPEKCPDRELAGRWETWLAQWERLVGEDRPELLDQRLRLRGEHVPPDRLGWATEAAAAYPNDYWLLYNLSEAYRKDWCDATMGLSLCVAALQNRYLTGEGNKDWAKAGVVTCLQELGQDAAVVAWVIPTLQEDQAAGKTNDFALGSMFLGRSLARAGWYDRAVGAFQDAYEKSQEDRPWRSRMLMEGGVAAALAGRADVLAQILQDRRAELDRMQMTFLLEGYLRLIQGKPITVEEVEQQCVTKDYDFRVDKDVLCAQIDLLSKKSTHRAPLTAHLTRALARRPLWILFDLYDRQEPRADSAAFYEAAEWLYGEDPWVRRAVADYHRRVAKPVLPAPQKLLQDLKDYPPERWPTRRPEHAQQGHEFTERTPPGTVDAVILALLRRADYDRAEQVALRFHRLSVDMGYWVMRTHANRLIHVVEEARAAKSSPEASGK